MTWKEVVTILIYCLIALVIIFFNSLLEGSWWCLKEEDVVKYELKYGANHRTQMIRLLLDEKPVVVGLILFWLAMVLYLSSLGLGWLTAGHLNQWLIVGIILGYPILCFYVGEVLSKTLGFFYAWPVALRSVYFVWAGLRLCFPITWLLRLTYRLVKKVTKSERQMTAQEEDVVVAAEIAKQNGALHEVEVELIKKFLKVGNQPIRSLITPINKCLKLTVKTTISNLRAVGRQQAPILIIDAHDKLVIGSLSAEDVVKVLVADPTADKIDLSRAVGGVVTLPAEISVTEALKLLKKSPVGIVRDQGKLVGVITLRDIVEDFMGVEELD